MLVILPSLIEHFGLLPDKSSMFHRHIYIPPSHLPNSCSSSRGLNIHLLPPLQRGELRLNRKIIAI